MPRMGETKGAIMLSRPRFCDKTRQAFTLVELAVVVVIVGVLAAFGVPRLLKSVERSKSAEAFSYLTAVRAAQERYHAKEGTFADNMSKLDIQIPAPKYFTLGTIGPDGSGTLQTSWSLTLTRTGSSAGFGAYTVIFTQDGFKSTSSIVADVNPQSST
jgi:prepilin-type N-terminal cleavage/methylation domain-containing protein